MRNGACLSNENKNCMPLATGKMGENEIEILRDRGCNGVIVRRELVKKEDFTGRMVMWWLSIGYCRRRLLQRLKWTRPTIRK